ncbi:hypothetical protein ATANTOWER_005836, partial [Ataeniobius toweri]|nr:hypothetical protein [Ataeniobius toweri]
MSSNKCPSRDAGYSVLNYRIFWDRNEQNTHQTKFLQKTFLLINSCQLLTRSPLLAPTQANFLARHVTSSRVEERTGGESTNWAGPTSGNQTGSESAGKGRSEEVDTAQTHPLEVLSGHPSSLDFTLQHIVQQLDILTQ